MNENTLRNTIRDAIRELLYTEDSSNYQLGDTISTNRGFEYLDEDGKQKHFEDTQELTIIGTANNRKYYKTNTRDGEIAYVKCDSFE